MKYLVSLLFSLFGSASLVGMHPVKFEMQLLAVDANEGLAVADFDKDGKLDVSAGRNWYRNPGKSGAWVPRPQRSADADDHFHGFWDTRPRGGVVPGADAAASV